jgi:hypothetical protein
MRSIDERYKDHCRLAVTERWWCRTKERDKGVRMVWSNRREDAFSVNEISRRRWTRSPFIHDDAIIC